ncbi:MAG TPA: peptidoglycan-binding domain-containing protein [Candidatus Paceibacterota bacterium]
MTNIINRIKLSKGILIGAGMMMVFAMAMLISVPQAKAESPNILVGQNMTIGSTGQGVVVLQGLMSELGYLNVPAGIPFGYYGPLTKDAVARYQAATNVSPPVGYYGPITKISMHGDFARHNWLTLLGW